MCFRQHLFKAARERHLPRQFPPARKAFEKFLDLPARLILDFGFWVLDLSERQPEMAGRAQPDLRQFIQRQTDERRTQHGDARHVLQRVVEQLQQAQQI